MNEKTVVEYGERPCQKCGKPHNSYRDPLQPNTAASWADPDDGHIYEPRSWESLYREAVAA
jgi:hypothetical protein